AMQQSFINIVSSVLGIVMAVVMMFLINALMAIFSVIMIPLSLIIFRTIVKISQKYFQGMQNSLGDLNAYLQENMTGFSVLKLY
ncbi:ABC transporter transmembrane domain-containing protein, partial [Enterococcus faecalis]|uniref:ABC transporter transmembrane domain-containing protein n=1 Tax=Enterococcus faecalis TaxID=1351 RepID=UPI003D6C107A